MGLVLLDRTATPDAIALVKGHAPLVVSVLEQDVKQVGKGLDVIDVSIPASRTWCCIIEFMGLDSY